MTEQATLQPSSITLEDLMIVVQIIQLCSTRGAFKAEELTSVGGIYDKLLKFLESAGALQKVEPKAGSTAFVPGSTTVAHE